MIQTNIKALRRAFDRRGAPSSGRFGWDTLVDFSGWPGGDAVFGLDSLAWKLTVPDRSAALPGRDQPMPVPAEHFVTTRPLVPPFPDEMEQLFFGLGCFWGAERVFWQLPGVYTTAVGYSGGITPNPTYQDVCSGQTGHSEVVLVVFEQAKITCDRLFLMFWESHDPTQGMRQGNDLGTQYRSCIYYSNDRQREAAEASRVLYQRALSNAGHGQISTELKPAGPFYYAEEYHQQYLAKNPGGYCGLGGTGVSCA